MIRPGLLRSHHRGRRPADLVKAGQVDGEDAVPLLARELVDGDAVGQRVDAGVVHQDVEPAALRDDLLDARAAISSGFVTSSRSPRPLARASPPRPRPPSATRSV